MAVADSFEGIPFSSSAQRRSVPELEMSALSALISEQEIKSATQIPFLTGLKFAYAARAISKDK